jgi:squalene-hopene/tetraprenyl-beta-curcumene cyclase
VRSSVSKRTAWDLYVDGAPDVSASVKAYFALKAAGDAPDAPHMKRARDAILKLGGAAKSNVFTRILLATFGQVPWRATPFMPIEFVLFPKWVPISMYKVAYWARTTMVPLLVLCSLKRARAIRTRCRSPNCSSRRRTRSATTFRPARACASCFSRSTARYAISNR